MKELILVIVGAALVNNIILSSSRTLFVPWCVPKKVDLLGNETSYFRVDSVLGHFIAQLIYTL